MVVVDQECLALHEPAGVVLSNFTAGFSPTEIMPPFPWQCEQRRVVLCSRLHVITLLENLQIFAFVPALLT